MSEPKTITVQELVDLCHQYTMLSVYVFDESGNNGITVRFKTKAVAAFVVNGRATRFMATNGFNSFGLKGDSFIMTIEDQSNQGSFKYVSFTLQSDDFCCIMQLIA